VDQLIRAIGPGPDDTFIEIGPGRGAITRALAARSRRVVAFEIDRDLAAALQETAPPNLTVAQGDFLDVTPERLRSVLSLAELSGPLRVAGNLPYNVAAPILFRLLQLYAAGVPLSDAHLMVQREVADRLAAKPGTREYGALTVLVGHSAAVQRILALPPGAFRPAPKVHSAVVRVQFHPPHPPVKKEDVFTGVVRLAFSHRRKTLANALGRRGGLLAGIDPARRPETLSIAEFARLADALAETGLTAAAGAVL
jgi:16S rRNA (adenine1518-N6/adenine1519-N6)-dimethyltransferase